MIGDGETKEMSEEIKGRNLRALGSEEMMRKRKRKRRNEEYEKEERKELIYTHVQYIHTHTYTHMNYLSCFHITKTLL